MNYRIIVQELIPLTKEERDERREDFMRNRPTSFETTDDMRVRQVIDVVVNKNEYQAIKKAVIEVKD